MGAATKPQPQGQQGQMVGMQQQGSPQGQYKLF
jgi:hypothetical protein